MELPAAYQRGTLLGTFEVFTAACVDADAVADLDEGGDADLRAGSIVLTSNRAPDEWLATFADPMRTQSAIDRFTSNAYDLVIEGESYRKRLKPTLKTGQRKEA